MICGIGITDWETWISSPGSRQNMVPEQLVRGLLWINRSGGVIIIHCGNTLCCQKDLLGLSLEGTYQLNLLRFGYRLLCIFFARL